MLRLRRWRPTTLTPEGPARPALYGFGVGGPQAGRPKEKRPYCSLFRHQQTEAAMAPFSVNRGFPGPQTWPQRVWTTTNASELACSLAFDSSRSMTAMDGAGQASGEIVSHETNGRATGCCGIATALCR